jgi:hypothetical protein
MTDERRSMLLLVCCLSLLPEDTKGRITYYTDMHYLDRALHKMDKGELFPEWFSGNFHYDPLYQRLGGLREALSQAVQSLLVQYDGTAFHYRILVNDSIRYWLLNRIGILEKDAIVLAEDLGCRLLEIENSATAAS